jgi:hypothetical protein
MLCVGMMLHHSLPVFVVQQFVQMVGMRCAPAVGLCCDATCASAFAGDDIPSYLELWFCQQGTPPPPSLLEQQWCDRELLWYWTDF